MVKIKEWRQGLGITQKALADAAGLDLRWVQKLEAGDSKHYSKEIFSSHERNQRTLPAGFVSMFNEIRYRNSE